MSAKGAERINRAVIEVFIFTSIVFVLLLTFVNVKKYFTPKKVLGAETQVDPSQKFWEDFLTKNPNYLPGLKETGNIEKVKEIDPNWE